MKKITRYVGLDVHAETIVVAVAERDGEVRSLGMIRNRPEAIRKLVKKLAPTKDLKVCYEAGPTGYALYWELSKLDVACEVIAPTLVPTKAGDRVKTDRRDAAKLARCYRSGDLTPVWVPDKEHEALRDLVRAREAAKKDQLRDRHRLSKLLLRHGLRPAEGVKSWSATYLAWVKALELKYKPLADTLLDYRMEVEHAADRIKRLEKAIDEAVEQVPPAMRAVIDALQALRGVAKLTAVTIVSEVGTFSRFAKAKQLMGYAGIVPSEYSSGESRRQFAITKTGNAHLRRVLGEGAWSYRHRPAIARTRKPPPGVSEDVKKIAGRAQERLHKRFWRLSSRQLVHQKVVTAVARELLGFVWAVGVQAEQEAKAANLSTQRDAA